ncbi:MAG: hypothetical protein ACOYD6_05110 [Limnochordia bacterium]|jgi:hypothetical protein
MLRILVVTLGCLLTMAGTAEAGFNYHTVLTSPGAALFLTPIAFQTKESLLNESASLEVFVQEGDSDQWGLIEEIAINSPLSLPPGQYRACLHVPGQDWETEVYFSGNAVTSIELTTAHLEIKVAEEPGDIQVPIRVYSHHTGWRSKTSGGSSQVIQST